MGDVAEATLTREERAIVDDSDDVYILEQIKSMTPQELRVFDSYGPIDFSHYVGLEKEWLERAEYLIAHRLGHSLEVSDSELLEDVKENHLAERFRAWYVLKFPERTTRVH